MEVVVGTYNQVLFGFSFKNLKRENSPNKQWDFGPLFTDQGHAGCIKAVASNGRYLCSGSSDETIRLFDLKKHIEVGTLMEQSGSITCLTFCGTAHMLSGSEDGTVCLWKAKTWELIKTLKGHRGPINSISIHPSGRLALTVSKDKNIKTWNLSSGRAAYTTSLKEVGELVKWSPNGESYAIVSGCKVTFHKITGIDEPHVYTCEKYVITMEFLTDSVVVIGGESEDIIFFDHEKELVLQRLEAHSVRTKAICVTDNPENLKEWLMFTTSSDGNLKAWSVFKDDLEKKPKLLAALDLPGRPTCMTVKIPIELKQKKDGSRDPKNESTVVEQEEKEEPDNEVDEEDDYGNSDFEEDDEDSDDDEPEDTDTESKEISNDEEEIDQDEQDQTESDSEGDREQTTKTIKHKVGKKTHSEAGISNPPKKSKKKKTSSG